MRSKLYQDRKQQNLPRYKYSFDKKIYNLNNSSSIQQPHSRSQSFDNNVLPDPIKSKPRFSIGRNSSSMLDSNNFNQKTPYKLKKRQYLKLPSLHKNFTANPQDEINMPIPDSYYQAKLLKAIKTKQNTYLSNLARQHFTQCIEALKIGKSIKSQVPKTQIRLSKRNPKFKTIYLDMDECLIHCDEHSTNNALVLDFPIDEGGTISAGVRIRPYCQQFIEELSNICEVIIFTASSASYADVILDHLDPHKKYFSHRLYRQHCTLTKGFFVKDLRVVNRKLQQCLLVDNSAFSFMLQPNNGVPILPFYQYAKDKQLVSLLQFLKRALLQPDMRNIIKETFFWQKLLKQQEEHQKIFLKHFGIQ